MVSRHDPFITDEERAKCHELAGEIGGIARELVEVFGVEPKDEAELGEFLKEYEDSAVHIVWSGPKTLPSGAHYKVLVFRKRPFVPKGRGGWPPVAWMFDSAPASLECDTDLAEIVLEHLRRVVALKCHCCGHERPRYWTKEAQGSSWLRLETNLRDVAAPEKIVCSRECVEKWSRRHGK